MTWQKVKLGDVADFINGAAFKPEDWTGEGKPIIRIQNLTGQSRIFNYTTREVPQKFHVSQGELLVSWSATLGVYEWQGADALLNQHIFRVDFKRDKIDKNYLRQILSVSIGEMASLTHGSTMKHINRGEFLGTEIPLPPLSEQKRLAAILDRADDLRRVRRQVLAGLDELAQSLFLELFGDPATNPKGWNVVRLGDVCPKSGKYGANASASEFRPGLPRYIRITDIDENGDLRSAKVGLDSDEWQDYVLEAGDLLFARSGATVGKTYLVKESDGLCVYAGYLIRFQTDKSKLHPIYLSEFTRSEDYNRWVTSKQNVVAQPNINAKQYADLEIPLPPLELQQQFALQIEELEAIKARARASRLELDALFASLQSRAFAGELSPAST